MTNSSSAAENGPRRSRFSKRPVGPRLRLLLYVVFALTALVGVNSAYLASITALEWISRRWGQAASYQDHVYLSMFAIHVLLGLLLTAPFLVFAIMHMLAAWRRRNRRAVRIGYALLGVSVLLIVSGLLLVRLEGLIDLKHPNVRAAVYWVHVLCPFAAIWLYWLHRLAGPGIRWRVAQAYAATAAIVVLAMVIWQLRDFRPWQTQGPPERLGDFSPSEVRTTNGTFIPADTLMMDQYCRQCHADAYKGWFHSVHHFSSFNNPPYRASVNDTRRKLLQRDGDDRAVRLCAACHDPVPLLSGAFQDGRFDEAKDPTAQAGITCTVCHAVTEVHATVGNGSYTIEEPPHYPFARSDNGLLQYLNHQLIRAKPAFHKQTFLKPFHKSAEFCSVCHKVNLPGELTHYKEFLRGQNHYDSFLLSGVSGHGARSFYYPEQAEANCNQCHMPLEPSADFGAAAFDDSGVLKIHGHLFPSANTAMAHLRDEDEVVRAHQEFLEGVMRVDIFGVKEDGSINGQLTAPLRPEVPTLEPGKTYLLETVIRTLRMGHLFTEGTADSNEVWLDVTVTAGQRVIGRSGSMDAVGEVDRWAHFVNVFMLDREGRRINRRNAEDIFVPLYNHQIPPGAAQVVHYALEVPDDLSESVTVDVKLQFRKFDYEYMKFVAESSHAAGEPLRGYRPEEPYVNDLPVTTLATDRITFPVAADGPATDNAALDIPAWQRWNDYGIGLLLEGRGGGAKGELRQAAAAFAQVEALDRYDGPLNLARVYFAEGRLDEAVDAVNRAAEYEDAPSWTIGWLSGLVNKQQGYLEKAISNFRSVLEDRTPEMIHRRLDFSRDYEIVNQLGQSLFERAKQFRGEKRKAQREQLMREAVEQFQKTLQIDSENVNAHYNLALLYTDLGEEDRAAEHRTLHARYKPDDNARDRAVAAARRRYPAANRAAEPLVIYSLKQDDDSPDK